MTCFVFIYLLKIVFKGYKKNSDTKISHKY